MLKCEVLRDRRKKLEIIIIHRCRWNYLDVLPRMGVSYEVFRSITPNVRIVWKEVLKVSFNLKQNKKTCLCSSFGIFFVLRIQPAVMTPFSDSKITFRGGFAYA